jgi:hypothetical protein
MQVGIFYSSISNPTKFSNKTMLMDNFRIGVESSNDIPVNYMDYSLNMEHLDAGFVLGYTLQDNFRKIIINSLIEKNIPRIFVDSNILGYANPNHKWHRYSLNSVYPDDGIYFFGELDKTKWDTYSKFHNVELKPWRNTGNHILIFCQRPKGWNLFGINQERWLDKTMTKIRKHSDRPIIVRMHPGDGSRFKQIEVLNQKYGNSIIISQNQNITDDLKNCWCTVGYNSTPNVVSTIEGIPSIITDPIHSWGQGISGEKLNTIEDPIMPDREEWIHRIANIHWSDEEIYSGKLWSMIKNYISSVR